MGLNESIQMRIGIKPLTHVFEHIRLTHRPQDTPVGLYFGQGNRRTIHIHATDNRGIGKSPVDDLAPTLVSAVDLDMNAVEPVIGIVPLGLVHTVELRVVQPQHVGCHPGARRWVKRRRY